jgi:hypothetical protein
MRENPNKQGQLETVRYKNGRLFPNFKTGALNHSATLPCSDRERHSKAGRAAKGVTRKWTPGRALSPCLWRSVRGLGRPDRS